MTGWHGLRQPIDSNLVWSLLLLLRMELRPHRQGQDARDDGAAEQGRVGFGRE